MKIDDEIKGLFRKVRTACGAPIRKVQLEDSMLCDLLEMCVEDVAEKTQNFLVENQWATVYGKNISTTDMSFALLVRSLDMARDYSYYFSKEAGLQQRGPWELKKDFIEVERGKQNYLIPAGREINKVMYVTPSTTDAALYAGYGGFGAMGFGGGMFQMAGGALGMQGGVGGFYINQAVDVAYLATDFAFKNKVLHSDLTYKVTAGPNGTHILHLLSTPGSRFSFTHTGMMNGFMGLMGCQIWYTYYDVNSADEADECRRQNPDVILTPDMVPLDKMEFAFMNEPTKVIVRQLLIAKAKETLGIIRGTNSGRISIPIAELTLDYQMLLSQGQEEYRRAMDALAQRLERMSPYAIMEKQAKLVQDTRETLLGTPFTTPIYVI